MAGAWKYSEHPSTEVICMAYSVDRGAPKLWLPGNMYPDFLLDPSEYHLSAWGAFFEQCIIRNTLKLEPAPIPQWTDTMVLAANLSLPLALGTCAKAVGLPEDKQKLKEGRDLINKLCKPGKNGKRNRDPVLLNKFYEYCKQDVVTEMAVGDRCGPLIPVERELWELDQKINTRGCQFDIPAVKNAIKMRDERVDELQTELSDITGLECEKATEVQKLKKYINNKLG